VLYDRLYINDGKGVFIKSKELLPVPHRFESSSCVSAADFDGDGFQDLFIGIRLKPGRYGYPCSSYILRNNGKGQFTDVTEQVAPGLHNLGMVTDAKWFDYDRDGKPDLVVAGEYMPLTLFHNEGKQLKSTTVENGLGKTNGWWNRLVIADVNGDGYLDIVAGNHGLNSRFKASESRPVTMISGDFEDNGITQQIICTYNGNEQYPMVLRHDLVGAIPSLKKKFLKYADYKEKKLEAIFTDEQLKKSVRMEAYEMRSSVFLNNGGKGFVIKPLPTEAQFAPVYGIVVGDFDHDGKQDILLGGNFYQSKPEAGIYDGSYGLFLKGTGRGDFKALSISESNFFVKGAIRNMQTIKTNERNIVLIARNNENLKVVEY
jgi:enediyne biosynthesis protein E4